MRSRRPGRATTLALLSAWLTAAPALAADPKDDADGPFAALVDWAEPPVQSGRSMVKGYSVYAGYLVERGFGEASVWTGGQAITPNLVGFTYWERQGVISGVLMGIVASLAGAAESAMPKSVEHEDVGNVRTTTITYRSREEKDRIVKEAAERGGRIASASNQSFELTVYSRNLPGAGDGSGFKLNMFFGIPMGESGLFELGVGGGSIDAMVGELDAPRPMRVHSFYAGVPLRLSWGFRWFALYTQFDWNIAGHFETKADFESERLLVREVRPFPLRAGAQTNLFGRLFVDVSAVTPDPRSREVGWRLATGIRF